MIYVYTDKINYFVLYSLLTLLSINIHTLNKFYDLISWLWSLVIRQITRFGVLVRILDFSLQMSAGIGCSRFQVIFLEMLFDG